MREVNENHNENSPKLGRIGYRPYWVYKLSPLIRAVHQVGAAVFLGACLLDAVSWPPIFYVVVALVSGGLLLVIEWLRHRQLFRELAGMITVAKILLLGAAYHGFLPLSGTTLLAFVMASIGAHAPKRVRHRLLF
jgi:hypothetical protein